MTDKTWETGDDAFPPENSPLLADTRTEARLLAVQALAQARLRGQHPADVAAEFTAHRLKKRQADKKLFAAILAEAQSGAERHAQAIAANLLEGWPAERLDPVHYAILWAGLAELSAGAQTPPKVILNEYVNISKGFCDPKETAFLNATLDKLARMVRGESFPAQP
jgi:N utilization substance protein B